MLKLPGPHTNFANVYLNGRVQDKYSVTIQVVSNLPLTTKQKFHFSMGPMN